MSTFLEHLDFFDHPIMLPEEFRQAPLLFLKRFFSDYKLSELWDLQFKVLETCLSSGYPPFDDAQERADIILFHKNKQLLFEAAFLLLAQLDSNDES